MNHKQLLRIRMWDGKKGLPLRVLGNKTFLRTLILPSSEPVMICFEFFVITAVIILPIEIRISLNDRAMSYLDVG